MKESPSKPSTPPSGLFPAAEAQRSRQTFLLVDDEELVRASMRRFFTAQGHGVLEADSVAQTRRVLDAARPDAAVVDYQLPDGDGLDLLRTLKAVEPPIPVVILTAHGSIDLAVRAIKEGAEQFLTKPVELPTLLLVLERLVEQRRYRQATLANRSRVAREAADPFFGESPAIRRLEEQARKVADSPACLLLEGESGTGKGLLAGWLHRNSPRSEEAFVDLNCAGLARDLLESELFGHEKGAFTGAVGSKPGLLEIAHRGTLFLDEVGDADLQVQPKLLKVLEEQRFRRIGDVRDRQVDVRLIAASHHDLRRMVQDHKFREDLFYRISAVPLSVPALRDRGHDVTLLGRSLLQRIAADLGVPGVKLTGDAERALLAYSWPGNIRELRNVLERAVLLGNRSLVTGEDLAPVLGSRPGAGQPQLRTLREAERVHIESVLRGEGGDVSQAAKVLGLSRSALYQKIKKHLISLHGFGSN